MGPRQDLAAAGVGWCICCPTCLRQAGRSGADGPCAGAGLGTLLLRWLNSWSRALASESGLGGDCSSEDDEQRSQGSVGLGSFSCFSSLGVLS